MHQVHVTCRATCRICSTSESTSPGPQPANAPLKLCASPQAPQVLCQYPHKASVADNVFYLQDILHFSKSAWLLLPLGNAYTLCMTFSNALHMQCLRAATTPQAELHGGSFACWQRTLAPRQGLPRDLSAAHYCTAQTQKH